MRSRLSLPLCGIFCWSLLCVADGASKPSPVEKVVQLLRDLKYRLGNDASTEQIAYDKYACWCTKTSAQKGSAIEQAKALLTSLGQEIIRLRGEIATLSADIVTLTGEIKTNEQDQADATTIRQKEHAAYAAESAEMSGALAAIEKSMMVLGAALGQGDESSELQLRHRRSAFLQTNMEAAVSSVRAVITALPSDALGRLPAAQLQLLQQFAEAQGASRAHYAPQSQTIAGILKSMYDILAGDLESTTSDEARANSAFEQYIGTKQKELALLQDSLKKKDAEKSEVAVTLAERAQLYDDTEDQMKADVEFFDDTKSACSANADAMQQRKTLREEEINGINKALEILTSDEGRDLFLRAIKPGIQTFLQVKSSVSRSTPAAVQQASRAKQQAYDALKAKATRSKSIRLANIAASVRLAKGGHFDEVIKSIDAMIELLKTEESEDAAKKDECLGEYQKINSTTADLEWKIEVNQAQIAKLEVIIEQLDKEKKQTIKEHAEVTQQISDLDTQRIDENTAFKAAKADDEQAILLLQAAQDALLEYYRKHGIDQAMPVVAPGLVSSPPPSLLVQSASPGPTPIEQPPVQPPPDFTLSDKDHRALSTQGIASLMQMIIEDLKGEISTAVRDEAAAVALYTKSRAALVQVQTDLDNKRINLEGAITDRKSDKTDEENLKKQNEADLKAQRDYYTAIRPDCDWIISSIEERRDKRKAEMDGLVQAKAFLAGYKVAPASPSGPPLQ